MKISRIIVTGILALGAAPAFASSVTNTPEAGAISAWGPSSGGNQSYGVVFTAPGSTLDNFSLTVSSDTPFPFVAQVYAWDGSETTGPALYTSAQFETTSAMTTYTFNSDVAVTGGDSYIAFVTNQPDGTSLGGAGSGAMADGAGPATFYFAEGAPDAAGAWFAYSGTAQFNAVFGAVPEPASWAMMLVGFAGMGAMLRRQRKAPLAA
jgi:hypothetical protein